MWDVIPQPGLASAVLDFTSELSPLIVGLMGLVALAVGVLVVSAIRHYLAEKTRLASKKTPGSADRQKAA